MSDELGEIELPQKKGVVTRRKFLAGTGAAIFSLYLGTKAPDWLIDFSNSEQRDLIWDIADLRFQFDPVKKQYVTMYFQMDIPILQLCLPFPGTLPISLFHRRCFMKQPRIFNLWQQAKGM